MSQVLFNVLGGRNLNPTSDLSGKVLSSSQNYWFPVLYVEQNGSFHAFIGQPVKGPNKDFTTISFSVEEGKPLIAPCFTTVLTGLKEPRPVIVPDSVLEALSKQDESQTELLLEYTHRAFNAAQHQSFGDNTLDLVNKEYTQILTPVKNNRKYLLGVDLLMQQAMWSTTHDNRQFYLETLLELTKDPEIIEKERKGELSEGLALYADYIARMKVDGNYERYLALLAQEAALQ